MNPNKSLRDIAFFSLFDTPLHRTEVGFSHPKLRLVNDHHLLPDMNEDMIAMRQERQQRAESIIKKNQTWFQLLAAHPGVEMIALCNSLSWLQATDESDIDLLVVTKPGMIWQTRFALTSVLALLKKRPTSTNHSGKICLSFFVSSDHLDLSSVRNQEDVYMDYWLNHLIALYDPQNLLPSISQQKRVIGHTISQIATDNFLSKCFQLLFFKPSKQIAFLEKQSKKWQLNKFPEALKEAAEATTTDVVISDKMLKFHVNDRREEFQKRFDEVMRRLTLPAGRQAPPSLKREG